jgi:hypothetical protein
MIIHVCRRCEGCGHVAGGFQWEVAWSRWAPTAEAAAESFLEPHPCPDCGGTGALIELPDPDVPIWTVRRALRGVSTYAEHVAAVLHNQSVKAN